MENSATKECDLSAAMLLAKKMTPTGFALFITLFVYHTYRLHVLLFPIIKSLLNNPFKFIFFSEYVFG